jgi:GNAT superfamily N-acetyltransferase
VITVRRTTPADSLNVATVHVRSWQRAFVGVFPQPLLDGLDPVRRAASYGPSNPDNFTFVAEADGTIIGFAAAGPANPDRDSDLARDSDTARDSDPAEDGGGPADSDRDSDPDRHQRFDNDGEVFAIYVDPDRWSGGAGRALMDAAVAELRNRGYSRVVLWTAADTPQSHRFYQRYGFHQDGRTGQFTAGAGTDYAATVSIVRFVLPLT